MEFKRNDGGRSRYYKAAAVGDCVTRAVAIVTGKDYKFVYNEIKKIIGYTPRNGVYKKDTARVMEHFGGIWVACCGKGVPNANKVHLDADELPKGRLICQVSKHVTCVIDGVINDTYDPSRGGKRLVYGYWKF